MSSGSEGSWYQWTPANAASAAYSDIEQAIAAFESIDTDAGREAARWLREDALLDHPSTITYVLLHDGQIDGYFAIASGSVTLTQRHRKGLSPGQRDYLLSPTQGASLIAWVARHRDSQTRGRGIVLYALFIALKVSRLQGTPVAVLDPFDDETAALWVERYGFRRSRTPGGNDVRLWVPLHQR
ncbi:MAG TPA: hypothetical protein VK790_08965 [Solirubrobacteraceae bacterium]|jgi:hypothetical protein|nr:hypothetical protein [Solirubrobacteraceae bacterium]